MPDKYIHSSSSQISLFLKNVTSFPNSQQQNGSQTVFFGAFYQQSSHVTIWYCAQYIIHIQNTTKTRDIDEEKIHIVYTSANSFTAANISFEAH
jgi:hypothetical protein